MSQVDLFDYTLDRPPLVVLDTNILLLFLTGLADANAVTDFKRTRQFSREDFDLLVEILDKFRRIVTTPNVLTETSNLARQAADPLRERIFAVMSRLLPEVSEEYIPTRQLRQEDAFARLGVTDIGIAELAASSDPEILVLTDDVGLYEYAYDHGTTAVNFTHYVAANL